MTSVCDMPGNARSGIAGSGPPSVSDARQDVGGPLGTQLLEVGGGVGVVGVEHQRGPQQRLGVRARAAQVLDDGEVAERRRGRARRSARRAAGRPRVDVAGVEGRLHFGGAHTGTAGSGQSSAERVGGPGGDRRVGRGAAVEARATRRGEAAWSAGQTITSGIVEGRGRAPR